MLHTILMILFLAFLEGMLSFDNAMALALLAKPLPKEMQAKALTYGIAGAFLFRFLSLFVLESIIESPTVKLVGGLYLVFLAISSVLFPKKDETKASATPRQFWLTIAIIELTDMAFSIDSILASVGVSQKIAIVFAGAVIGIITMRFAANLFIGLITRFPRLELSAYILVFIIGLRMILEANDIVISTMGFWYMLSASLAYGFIPRKESKDGPKLLSTKS